MDFEKLLKNAKGQPFKENPTDVDFVKMKDVFTTALLSSVQGESTDKKLSKFKLFQKVADNDADWSVEEKALLLECSGPVLYPLILGQVYLEVNGKV